MKNVGLGRVLCSLCGGSGTSQDGRRDCPICRGSGVVVISTCKEGVR